MQPDSTEVVQRAIALAVSTTNAAERFAHFTIYRREDGELDVLGAGAMGITYRAFDTQLERPVALKVINPQYVHDPGIRSRFSREAKAAARLQHPNIASVLFQGEESGTCFYAMELVAGENLHDYVQRVGPLSPVHALQMAHQIALALVSAAKERVLHRDLKPANVMLTSYHEGGAPHLKVIDFGLAKLATDLSASFTTGGFLGTPEFASPEQCEEQPLDARSDLYSLGVTLWYLLTAQAPFAGSMLSVMKAHVSATPPFENLRGAPEALFTILRRLLAKNRDERPATPLDAAREIENAIGILAADRRNYTPLNSGSPAADAQAQQPASNRKKLLVSFSLVAACAAVAAAAFGIRGDGARNTARVESQGGASEADSAHPPEERFSRLAEQGAPPAGPDRRGNPEGALTNSLGMLLARVPGSDIQVSAWETRVRDFAAFSQATGYAAASGGTSGAPGWKAPGFPQDGNHPVVFVTVQDAQRFCAWLTSTERKAGRITAMQEYRLPTRRELDDAVGLMPPPPPNRGGERDEAQPPPRGEPDREDKGPFPRRGPQGPGGDERFRLPPRPGGPPREGEENDFPRGGGSAPRRVPPFYWGNHSWPPPPSFGNYADESAQQARAVRDIIPRWNDGFAFTAPVGRFSPSPYGVFDLSGNVWEMCHDGPPGAPMYGKLGGSWATSKPDELRLHQIFPLAPTERSAQLGFRCVLAPVR